MTLVLGMVDKDRKVHMIADSYSYDSTSKYPNTVKITRRFLATDQGNFYGAVLLASAGEHAANYIARNAPMPEVSSGMDPWEIIDGIAKSLQAFGADTPGGINYHGGCDQVWLVGWNGHLWTFVHYDILEQEVAAIGAGGDIARGAMGALQDEPRPAARLHKAADITASLATDVTPPWRYEVVEPL